MRIVMNSTTVFGGVPWYCARLPYLYGRSRRQLLCTVSAGGRTASTYVSSHFWLDPGEVTGYLRRKKIVFQVSLCCVYFPLLHCMSVLLCCVV